MIELILCVMITATLLFAVDIWSQSRRLNIILDAMQKEQTRYIRSNVLHEIEIYGAIQQLKEKHDNIQKTP